MSEDEKDDGLAERLYLAWWPPETAAPIPWCDLDEGDQAPFVRAAEKLEEEMGLRGHGAVEGSGETVE